MSHAVTFVAVYRPRPGKNQELAAIVRRHAPTLRREGLVTEHPTVLLRAADGSIIEILSWRSEEHARSAHDNPAVKELWAAFAQCCEFLPLKDLAEAQKMFAHFERIENGAG